MKAVLGIWQYKGLRVAMVTFWWVPDGASHPRSLRNSRAHGMPSVACTHYKKNYVNISFNHEHKKGLK